MADVIEKNYQRLSCYTEMDEADRKNFDILAERYGSILNQGPMRGITIYTSHDFDRHCFNLYRIISMYILGERGIRELEKEELYMLNISVLLHDISMCRGGYADKTITVFDRKIHSLQSAQWIRHEFTSAESMLRLVGLTSNQVEIICDICQAHSDLKDKDDSSGLFNPKLKFKKDGETKEIRVKVLAGILRVADELDVTSARLARAEEMKMLLTTAADDGRPEVQEFIKQDEESRKHFRRLLLISGLKKDDKDITVIRLILDSEQVKNRLDLSDEGNVVEDLRRIRNKIQKEIDELWSQVLSRPEANAGFLTNLKSVDWSSEDEELIEGLGLESCIDLRTNSSNDMPKEETATEPEEDKKPTDDGEPNEIEVKVLNVPLSQRIRQQVLSNQLLSVGHYQLNMVHCARDWIDTTELLNHAELMNDIISVFSNDISQFYGTVNLTIVGLDLMGATTAAQIGFLLQKPFTYVIPAHQHARADCHEIHVPGIPDDHKIIVVTDCIVTGQTISQIIDENNWEDRVEVIYTVFYRKAKARHDIERFNLLKRVKPLNADFSSEIALVADCPYGSNYESCQAENRRL